MPEIELYNNDCITAMTDVADHTIEISPSKVIQFNYSYSCFAA